MTIVCPPYDAKRMTIAVPIDKTSYSVKRFDLACYNKVVAVKNFLIGGDK